VRGDDCVSTWEALETDGPRKAEDPKRSIGEHPADTRIVPERRVSNMESTGTRAERLTILLVIIGSGALVVHRQPASVEDSSVQPSALGVATHS